MADPVTVIQTTADVVNASNSLLASLIAIIPTIGYVITAIAAFVPKPDSIAPQPVQWLYKAMTYIAFNVKHAKNTEPTTDLGKDHV